MAKVYARIRIQPLIVHRLESVKSDLEHWIEQMQRRLGQQALDELLSLSIEAEPQPCVLVLAADGPCLRSRGFGRPRRIARLDELDVRLLVLDGG